METNNTGDAGSHFIFTDGDNKAEIVPGQDEKLLRYLTCQDCGDLYQTTITIKTRNKNRDVKFCCGNCYIKKENSLDLVSIDEDVANFTGYLKLKCPEEGTCGVKSVSLNNYDEHRENHRNGKKRKLSGNTRAEKHMEVVENLLARKMETELPSTSQGRSSVQLPQNEPERDKSQVFSKIVKTMDLEAHKVLYEVFAPDQLLKGEIVDYYSTASMLAGAIKNKNGLQCFHDSLCNLETRESKEYTDFDTFCSTFFPEYARKSSSYMNKIIGDAIIDKHDRRARIKFCAFFNSCEISHLKLLKNRFDIYTGLSCEEEQKIDNFRKAMMIKICDINSLRLEKILQIFDNFPDCKHIADCLKREVVVDYKVVSDDIRKEFDQMLRMGGNYSVMCDQINDILTPYQCTQLALLLNITRCEQHKVVDFNSLYDLLNTSGVTVGELVLAMIDAQLFSGEVKNAITNRYGDPVKSTADLSQEEVILMQKSLPEYMSGEIEAKLMHLENRLARHKLLRCFEKCGTVVLGSINRHFELRVKSQYGNGFDFADIVCAMNRDNKTVENLFSFFKTEIGKYGHLIDILLKEEDVNLALHLSNEKLEKKLNHKVAAKTMDERIILLDIDGKSLVAKDIKKLVVILIKENDIKRELFADAKFISLFEHLHFSARPWIDLLAALQDLELMEAFRKVERMMSMAH